MLKDWVNVEERNIDELMNGVCVVPSIILLRLSEIELQTLNRWWKQWGNQLIVSPPFHQIDIISLLKLNVDVSITAMESQLFNNLSVIESIKTNSKSKWQLTDGEIIAVDHYEHSGSGCVTLTTVPLLNYRLLSQQEVCKKLFLELINEKANEGTDTVQEVFTMNPVHENILILAAAKVLDSTELAKQLSQYFNKQLNQNKATKLFHQLIHEKFLESSGALSVTGKEHINLKGYRAFVREIKRWRRDDGEWR
jgi:hypothetical protein